MPLPNELGLWVNQMKSGYNDLKFWPQPNAQQRQDGRPHAEEFIQVFDHVRPHEVFKESEHTDF